MAVVAAIWSLLVGELLQLLRGSRVDFWLGMVGIMAILPLF